MSDVDKIVTLLASDAVEKRIAAAIVLREFHALLDGLAASDADAAKAAAIAVRQRVKDADARQRRSYLAEAEKFLEKQAARGGSSGAIAAGVKILGYLEDEKAIATLLEFT